MSTLLFKCKQQRDVALRETDEKALHTLVQAAVNVELFTIPLYMTALYSLQGMHEINSQNSSVYKGRIWPGMSASSKTVNSNQLAYNAVFSVFVAEMLHLQIVSNLAKAVNYDPKFTCEPLQDEKTLAWKCYSPDSSVLPGILDFADTNKPHIRVNIGPMNLEQMDLFLAIEQTEEDARHMMTEEMFQSKYNQQAPYKDWQPGQPLPWFGSIGNMYMQLWKYLSIEYTDGKTLWYVLFNKALQAANPGVEIPLEQGDNRALCPFLQQEVFNPGRLNPAKNEKNEYPGMPTSINTLDSEKALLEVLNMINGITDQGEGAGVVKEILDKVAVDRKLDTPLTLKSLMATGNLMAVQNQFQPSCPVLRKKYPSYDADGNEVPSAKANARGVFGKMDHFETFEFVKTLIESGGITTWDQWHADGNKWTAEMLQTAGYTPDPSSKLPSTQDISDALNRLKLEDKDDKNYDLFSRTAAGAIAGVTRVLNDYFKNPKIAFPYPSMGGSGDRMAICWAVFGKVPDITLGIRSNDEKPYDRNVHIYHACQGMNLDNNPDAGCDLESCAPSQLFHACKGSNDCKAEGGCGFVQSTGGGSGCGGSAPEPGKGLPFSPPSDNACGGFGGCAVPISASQIYPALDKDEKYKMQLFDFEGESYKPTPFAIMDYAEGDYVYDVAWKAYSEVRKKQGKDPGPKPKPSDLRLAFPPST
ncbi:hypothetical protein EWM62_07085 [Mucilaginibacter terrigena]|uniref:Iminophenyl-pyruvate dimer synthase domain-containing protein n=1 Tax=Mucilaginibacter terrigena TaxID=2492395 RepID=A0A4Q5LQH6_9SPHI|nr:ferritin-like domain-containing protein [Mucilaginibacter terrigena]RYU91695.1 hypothetical protein EWM62_07085 [Mucilaginibacter terrigena]